MSRALRTGTTSLRLDSPRIIDETPKRGCKVIFLVSSGKILFRCLYGDLWLFHRKNTPSRMKLLLTSCTLLASPLIAASDPDYSSRAAEYMNSQVKTSRFTGAILVARNGKVLLVKGYGLSN